MLAAPTEAEGEDCEDRDASVSVTGVYDQQKVAGGSSCSLGAWRPFLPKDEPLEQVSLDHGIGGFTLGRSESAVRGLLAGTTPLGTAGGLDVYEPTGGLPGLEAVECRKDSDTLIMAFRYKRTSGLVTMMANLPELALGGEAWGTQQVETRCEGEGGVEEHEVPASLEALPGNWLHVTCGGREALADHPLSEGSKTRDTTLIIPALLPLVIVTSDPASACKDAARLHAEYGA